MPKAWSFWPQTHISILAVGTTSTRPGRQRHKKHLTIWLGPAHKHPGYSKPILPEALSALREGSSCSHRSGSQSLGSRSKHWNFSKTRSTPRRCSHVVVGASGGGSPPANNGKQNGSKSSRRKRTFASGLLGESCLFESSAAGLATFGVGTVQAWPCACLHAAGIHQTADEEL